MAGPQAAAPYRRLDEEGEVGGVLDGKVAIVTGAAQGIGRGVARALAKEGAAVVVVDVNEPGATSAAEEIAGLGARACGVAADVSVEEDVQRAVATALDRYGPVDVLVNAAQWLDPQTPFVDHTDELVARTWGSGLWGTFRFMRACFPHMRDRGGRIVNFASGAGTHGEPGFAAYAAAKEGIRGLTKVAANEWGQYGITVNAVLPSAASPISERWAREHPDEFAKAMSKRAIRRLGDAETDVGRAVVFLAGPDASYITGQLLLVNGAGVMMP